MSSDILIEADHVSKKFCRSLKRSLWYGVKDVAHALNPFAAADSHGLAASRPALRKDEFWAVKDVSFQLRRGECLGLIGHNGAGKSTLLKLLNGLIRPDQGSITMRGRVGALIELNAGFNPILTGRENIFNQAAILGFNRKETEEKFAAIVDFAEIEEFLDMPVQNYSSGMRVRLGFAVSAQMEPDILLIDEVLAVGDVDFRMKCLNTMSELMRRAAVIFVSHAMPQVIRVSTEVLMMDHGRVHFQGRDVAAVTNQYLSLAKNAEASIAGSGEVRVESVALLSGAGASATLGGTLPLDHGDSLRLSACLRFAAGVRRAHAQFLLWSAEMLPVLDIVTSPVGPFGFDVPPDGEVIVTAYLPKVELGAGKYNLSFISLSDDQRTVFCRHDNAAYILVNAVTGSGSYFLATADWNVKAATATTPPPERSGRRVVGATNLVAPASDA